MHILFLVVFAVWRLDCCHSFGWSTPAAGRRTPLQRQGPRVSFHTHPDNTRRIHSTSPGSPPGEPSNGDSNPSVSAAQTVESDDQVSRETFDGEQAEESPERQRQPWWEEERRTEGMPTLTSSTQWRMTLSLKARNYVSVVTYSSQHSLLGVCNIDAQELQ